MRPQRYHSDRENEIKAMIAAQLLKSERLLHGYKVFLYGSRARGNARTTSDFDIGILGDKPLPLVAFYQIEDMLEELPTLYKIDLVDLNRTSPQFKEQALKYTDTLYG
jgi:predicted nucleotidyltransferase